MTSIRANYKKEETAIVGSICEYLEKKHYFFYRSNNIPIYDPIKKIFRKLPKYCIKGVSDIFLLKNGKPIFIEAKTDKGTQSKEQKVFEILVKSNGGDYILAKSLDDIKKAGL